MQTLSSSLSGLKHFPTISFQMWKSLIEVISRIALGRKNNSQKQKEQITKHLDIVSNNQLIS
jgi:hypothetical protein